MIRSNRPQASSIPHDEYSHKYFQSSCDGFQEYRETTGDKLPLRLKMSLKQANLADNMFALDIGCGRGELLYHSAKKGAWVWGIDYSTAAMDLTRKTISSISSKSVRNRIAVLRGNALYLPFEKESFDVVFMNDIVEHLSPKELDAVFAEVRSVLKSNGVLIVHTMPNLWYYRVGYRVFRGFQWSRGIRLPRDPRDRWNYKQVHINEQTPLRLKKSLNQAGFTGKVWLRSTQTYDNEGNTFIRSLLKFSTRAFPFRWFFCNDIFAVARIQS